MMEIQDESLCQEIQELVIAILYDEATAEQVARLNELIDKDVQARNIYLTIIDDEISLRMLADSSDSFVKEPIAQPAQAKKSKQNDVATSQPRTAILAQLIDWNRHPIHFLATVLTLTVILWGSWFVFFLPQRAAQQADLPDLSDEISSQVVARLANVIHARWGEEESGWVRGSKLRLGQNIELTEGLAEIVFENGTSLLLEGPVKLELKHHAGVKLSTGTLVASVPAQAIGFFVETKSAIITDLGTEFSVRATPNGECNVWVLEGSVEVAGVADSGQRNDALTLRAGESISVDAAGVVGQGVKVPADLIQRLPDLSAATTVLALDFNARVKTGPITTEPNFNEFVLSTSSGTTTRNYGELSVSLSVQGGGAIDDHCHDPFRAGERVTAQALLRDFIHGPREKGESLHIQIAGLSPNQLYEVLIWSFSHNRSKVALQSNWYANRRHVHLHSIQGRQGLTSNNSHRFGFLTRANEAGEILLMGEPAGGRFSNVVFLNGLQIRKTSTDSDTQPDGDTE